MKRSDMIRTIASRIAGQGPHLMPSIIDAFNLAEQLLDLIESEGMSAPPYWKQPGSGDYINPVEISQLTWEGE